MFSIHFSLVRLLLKTFPSCKLRILILDRKQVLTDVFTLIFEISATEASFQHFLVPTAVSSFILLLHLLEVRIFATFY